MNVILIGMPGAGKSRLGKRLSEKLKMKYFDTDKYIRDRYGDIPKIFSEKGEVYFREKETESAFFAAKLSGSVISTGGGMVLRRENMTALKSCGTVVYLKASKEALLKRTAGSSRPLLKGDAEKNIENLLQKRTPLYETYADITVDVSGDDVEEKTDRIISLLGRNYD